MEKKNNVGIIHAVMKSVMQIRVATKAADN